MCEIHGPRACGRHKTQRQAMIKTNNTLAIFHSKSVNHAERWRENPTRVLAQAELSPHLECWIHRLSRKGTFA